jgi:hypothetical protein
MSQEIRIAPADIIASRSVVAGHTEDMHTVHAASDARIDAAMTGWTDAKQAYFLIGFSGPIPTRNGTRRFRSSRAEQAGSVPPISLSPRTIQAITMSLSPGPTASTSSSPVRRPRRSPDVRTVGCDGLRPVCSHGEKSGQMSLRAHLDDELPRRSTKFDEISQTVNPLGAS